jgi:ADP-heptose:LPS heptosyltransferase
MQGYTYKGNSIKLEEPKVESDNSKKYVIWHIQGGLGKNIAGTALVKDLKEAHPDRKLIMVVAHPEVFLNNPYIDRVYQINQCPYFYQDYIENKDVIIFKHEPYDQTGHITKTKHLIENWCDILNIKYTKQQPEIFVNYVQKMVTGLWQRSKPIMLLQTGGGPANQQYSYSWSRDIPIEIAENIVEKYKNEYHIIQVTRVDGYQLKDVERMDKPLSNMELFALLITSTKRILIDSCLQHAATSFKIPSTVLWIGTSPIVFGYDIHNNIKAKLGKRANQLIGSYLFDYQFENNAHECPYIDVNDIFNIEDIYKSI